jgi:EAL domain
MYPEHATDLDTLLQRADVAMYLAKEHGTGYETYSASHDRYSPRRLTLLGELRRAIDQGELVLESQPIADILSGSVDRVEALVRWNHPEHGLLAPDEFIPLAEPTGLMGPLTRHVLELAISQVPRVARRRPRSDDRGQRVGAQRAILRARRRRGQPALEVVAPGDGARARDHRGRRHVRPPPGRGGAAVAQRPRHQHRPRRLRHRLLVARLSEAAPGRPREDRPFVRHQHGDRRRRRGHRFVDHRPGAEPRAGGRGRRHRERDGVAPAPRARLPLRAGATTSRARSARSRSRAGCTSATAATTASRSSSSAIGVDDLLDRVLHPRVRAVRSSAVWTTS